MNGKLLTEQMFLEGKWELEEPEILSRRDEIYHKKHSSNMTMSDVKALCEILQYPTSEIFAGNNIRQITNYGSITISGKEYQIGSHRVKNVLLDINYGVLNQDEVLHDVSKLLSKHKSDELTLKVKTYNRLISQGYMQLKPKN